MNPVKTCKLWYRKSSTVEHTRPSNSRETGAGGLQGYMARFCLEIIVIRPEQDQIESSELL